MKMKLHVSLSLGLKQEDLQRVCSVTRLWNSYVSFFFCLLNLWRGFKRNINTEEDIHLHHRHRSDALLLRPSHRLHPNVYLRHKLSHLLTRLWPTRRANTLQEHEQRFISSLSSLEWRRLRRGVFVWQKTKQNAPEESSDLCCLKSIFILTWPKVHQAARVVSRLPKKHFSGGDLRVCVKAAEPLSSAEGVASPEHNAGANLWGN